MANTTITNLFSAAQNITITLASLATAAASGRESTMLTSNNYVDGILHFKFAIGTGGNATSDGIQIYLARGSDATGQNLTDPVTGTDAAITWNTPSNITLVGIVNVQNTATHYDFHIASLAQSFGGNLPPYWSVVVQNAGGSTFTGTEGAFTKEWLPMTVAAG